MPSRWQKIGIIAGGGELPLTLAEGCKARGEPYFVLRLAGYADPSLNAHPGADCPLAKFGRAIRELKSAGCDAVTMAGLVRRPNFASLRPDWRGAALLPKVVAAARRGDGALLDVMVGAFANEGFMVVGADDIGTDLRAPHGAFGKYSPSKEDWSDIRKAAAVVHALGPFDVAQGAVIRNGFVLAIEAAEGTDQMLKRVAALPEDLRGFDPGEDQAARGVLLKTPKPGQELRVDLPTIGVQTIKLAKAAGLSGVAVVENEALVMGRDALVNMADAEGMFVIGVSRSELEASP